MTAALYDEVVTVTAAPKLPWCATRHASLPLAAPKKAPPPARQPASVPVATRWWTGPLAC